MTSDIQHILRRHEHANGVVTYRSDRLREVGVRHAFSTRIGGLSEGPFASLNLGYLTKDDAPDDNTSVAENFRRLRRAIGCERDIRVQARQVHGNRVWTPPAEPLRLRETPEADAIASDRPGTMLTIRVADCVPILMSSRDGKAVAAVHAGWRGIVAGVLPAAVRAMEERFGADPASIIAAIGPCISAEHFEVGPEVADAFRESDLAEVIDEQPDTRPHIDLSAAAALQLQRSGVLPDRIDSSDRCTYRDAGEFFSHRRDRGRTGRMAAVIAPGAKP